jgi:opacity protein-like surface antigen
MIRIVPGFVCCLLLLPGFARGQVAELWLGGGTSVLTNRGIGSFTPAGTPDDVQLKGGFRINFRMGLNSTRFTGHEFGYAYNRTRLVIPGSQEQGMAIHQGFYNYLLYATKEGFRVRPFATGGGHFSNFVPPGVSVTQGGGATKFGLNYGGGVKVRVTDMWGFRLDFRQYMTGKPFDLPLVRGWMRQNELSAGIGFLLQ